MIWLHPTKINMSHPAFFSPPSFFFFQMWIMWLLFVCNISLRCLRFLSIRKTWYLFSLWLGSHFFPWCEIFYSPFMLGWLKSVLFLQHSVLSVLLLRGISPAYLLLLLFKERKCFQLPADKIRSEWQQPKILWKNLFLKFKCSWRHLSSYSFCLCGKISLFITACQLNNRMGGANLKDMADWCNWKGLYN